MEAMAVRLIFSFLATCLLLVVPAYSQTAGDKQEFERAIADLSARDRARQAAASNRIGEIVREDIAATTRLVEEINKTDRPDVAVAVVGAMSQNVRLYGRSSALLPSLIRLGVGDLLKDMAYGPVADTAQREATAALRRNPAAVTDVLLRRVTVLSQGELRLLASVAKERGRDLGLTAEWMAIAPMKQMRLRAVELSRAVEWPWRVTSASVLLFERDPEVLRAAMAGVPIEAVEVWQGDDWSGWIWPERVRAAHPKDFSEWMAALAVAVTKGDNEVAMEAAALLAAHDGLTPERQASVLSRARSIIEMPIDHESRRAAKAAAAFFAHLESDRAAVLSRLLELLKRDAETGIAGLQRVRAGEWPDEVVFELLSTIGPEAGAHHGFLGFKWSAEQRQYAIMKMLKSDDSAQVGKALGLVQMEWFFPACVPTVIEIARTRGGTSHGQQAMSVLMSQACREPEFHALSAELIERSRTDPTMASFAGEFAVSLQHSECTKTWARELIAPIYLDQTHPLHERVMRFPVPVSDEAIDSVAARLVGELDRTPDRDALWEFVRGAPRASETSNGLFLEFNARVQAAISLSQLPRLSQSAIDALVRTMRHPAASQPFEVIRPALRARETDYRSSTSASMTPDDERHKARLLLWEQERALSQSAAGALAKQITARPELLGELMADTALGDSPQALMLLACALRPAPNWELGDSAPPPVLPPALMAKIQAPLLAEADEPSNPPAAQATVLWLLSGQPKRDAGVLSALLDVAQFGRGVVGPTAALVALANYDSVRPETVSELRWVFDATHVNRFEASLEVVRVLGPKARSLAKRLLELLDQPEMRGYERRIVRALAEVVPTHPRVVELRDRHRAEREARETRSKR
jgi:hypothetical protein